jgi:cell wall-associated NlpC family hydrolase
MLSLMKIVLLVCIVSLLSGCGSTPKQQPSSWTTSSNTQANQEMNDLVFYALSLADTPYIYGGNTPEEGFDCSGFVGYVFQHSLKLKLPRTSAEISKKGTFLLLTQLRPGDLVFYNTQKRAYSHVGIFVGEGKFVHAPKTGSHIRVERMETPYWKSRYNGSRRIR